MKLLLTGVHGFVGSNLVSALKNDNIIYGLDIVSPNKDGIVKTYSWEDMDNGLLPEVDAIIHMAGIAHDKKNKSTADVYFKVNIDLTKKCYDYFIKNDGIKKFLFFSSVKAAVDKVSENVLTEDVIPCPIGPYGESKVKAEKYIMSRIDDTRGRQVIILRPCMIHGPGNKGNLNLLYGFIRKGLPWPLGAFDNRLTFTSVDNLTFVISKLLEKDVESGIYNMADDDIVSTNDLIDVMCAAMDRKSHIWKVNTSLIQLCAQIGDVLHLPLNSFRLDKLTENYVVSNSKIKKALGIEKMPEDARSGLTKTIKSFISNR